MTFQFRSADMMATSSGEVVRGITMRPTWWISIGLGMAVSGTEINRQGTLTGLVGNRTYQMRVNVTNLAGMRSIYLVNFDTFSRTNFTFEASLDKVTGSSNVNQTLTAVGTFKGVGHHAQTYDYVPLTDAQSNLMGRFCWAGTRS